MKTWTAAGLFAVAGTAVIAGPTSIGTNPRRDGRGHGSSAHHRLEHDGAAGVGDRQAPPPPTGSRPER